MVTLIKNNLDNSNIIVYMCRINRREEQPYGYFIDRPRKFMLFGSQISIFHNRYKESNIASFGDSFRR